MIVLSLSLIHILICEEDNMPPTRSGRVNTLKTTKEELLKESCFEEGTLSQDALLYKRGNLAYTSYYKEGKVTIQDESSQLVARLLDPQKTDYVLDMCSAPGSKTTHLAALMENQGKIEAYDLYKHKVKLIEPVSYTHLSFNDCYISLTIMIDTM